MALLEKKGMQLRKGWEAIDEKVEFGVIVGAIITLLYATFRVAAQT